MVTWSGPPAWLTPTVSSLVPWIPVLAPVGNSQDCSQREVLNFPGYTFSHYTLDEARIFVHGDVAHVVGPAGSSASSPPDLPTHRPVSAAASSLLCIDVTLRPTQRKSLSPLLSPSRHSDLSPRFPPRESSATTQTDSHSAEEAPSCSLCQEAPT